jgi:hypothetical protein
MSFGKVRQVKPEFYFPLNIGSEIILQTNLSGEIVNPGCYYLVQDYLIWDLGDPPRQLSILNELIENHSYEKTTSVSIETDFEAKD